MLPDSAAQLLGCDFGLFLTSLPIFLVMEYNSSTLGLYTAILIGILRPSDLFKLKSKYSGYITNGLSDIYLNQDCVDHAMLTRS